MTKPARLILALLWVALIARAAPPNPGFYTFDGTQLRPLGLQRRAGSESFASNWRQLLQFGRTPSSFLAALKERSDTHEEDDDATSEHHAAKADGEENPACEEIIGECRHGCREHF